MANTYKYHEELSQDRDGLKLLLAHQIVLNKQRERERESVIGKKRVQ